MCVYVLHRCNARIKKQNKKKSDTLYFISYGYCVAFQQSQKHETFRYTLRSHHNYSQQNPYERISTIVRKKKTKLFHNRSISQSFSCVKSFLNSKKGNFVNFNVKKVFFNCSISCRCSLHFPHSSLLAFVQGSQLTSFEIGTNAYFKSNWI